MTALETMSEKIIVDFQSMRFEEELCNAALAYLGCLVEACPSSLEPEFAEALEGVLERPIVDPDVEPAGAGDLVVSLEPSKGLLDLVSTLTARYAEHLFPETAHSVNSR